MSDKEIPYLMAFVQALGWNGLRREEHAFREGDKEIEVVYYLCGELDSVFFQINTSPVCACVYAIPFEICTGWHRIDFRQNNDCMLREANRLKGFFQRDLFYSDEARQDFCRIHQECCGYTWERIRSEGPPYAHPLE